MVLTDGLANEGLTNVERLVNQARELRVRGITTSTFGVGYDFNQFLLQRIADAGGGHFYFIDDPEVIPAFFHGELGEMLSTVAKDIVLEIGVPKGASVEPLSGVPRELAENHRVRVLLGDAFSGQTRKIILRVELPAFQRNQHLLLPVALQYEDTLEARRVTIDQPGLNLRDRRRGAVPRPAFGRGRAPGRVPLRGQPGEDGGVVPRVRRRSFRCGRLTARCRNDDSRFAAAGHGTTPRRGDRDDERCAAPGLE